MSGGGVGLAGACSESFSSNHALFSLWLRGLNHMLHTRLMVPFWSSFSLSMYLTCFFRLALKRVRRMFSQGLPESFIQLGVLDHRGTWGRSPIVLGGSLDP